MNGEWKQAEAGTVENQQSLEKEREIRARLMEQFGQPDCQAAWESFASSGKIGDYLRYRWEESICRNMFF